MDEEQYNYASYLLRLWRAKQDGQMAWRASLECAQDGQRMNFASLEALMTFLQEQFGARGRGKEQSGPQAS